MESGMQIMIGSTELLLLTQGINRYGRNVIPWGIQYDIYRHPRGKSVRIFCESNLT